MNKQTTNDKCTTCLQTIDINAKVALNLTNRTVQHLYCSRTQIEHIDMLLLELDMLKKNIIEFQNSKHLSNDDIKYQAIKSLINTFNKRINYDIYKVRTKKTKEPS